MIIWYWLDQYVDVVERFIAGKLLFVPLLLLFLEEAGIPIPVPGDAIIAYTGYRLSTSHGGPGYWEGFIVAEVAVMAGASVLFFLSKRWGQQIVYKLGAFVFLQEKHIRHAEALFAKFGIIAIIVGRHIPGLRIPVTVFAATSGVRYVTFMISTFISSSIWIAFYLTIGKAFGVTLHKELQRYTLLSVIAVIAIIAVFVLLHVIGIVKRLCKQKATRSDS